MWVVLGFLVFVSGFVLSLWSVIQLSVVRRCWFVSDPWSTHSTFTARRWRVLFTVVTQSLSMTSHLVIISLTSSKLIVLLANRLPTHSVCTHETFLYVSYFHCYALSPNGNKYHSTCNYLNTSYYSYLRYNIQFLLPPYVIHSLNFCYLFIHCNQLFTSSNYPDVRAHSSRITT